MTFHRVMSVIVIYLYFHSKRVSVSHNSSLLTPHFI